MNEQIQRAYDALQQADAAGNVEDAQKIADYIRELEAQSMAQEQKPTKGTDKMLENPVTYGLGGALAGRLAGHEIGMGVDTAARAALGRKAPGAPTPSAPPAPTPRVEPSMAPPAPKTQAAPSNPVENWAKSQYNLIDPQGKPQGVSYGGRDYAEAAERQKAVSQAEKATSGAYRGLAGSGLMVESRLADELNQPRIAAGAPPAPAPGAAPAPAAPAAAPARPSALSRMSQVLGKGRMTMPPSKSHMFLGGGMAAGQARDAYEQLQEGNVGNAALSGTGALGGLGMFSRIKPVRAAGTMLGLGMPLARMYRGLTEDKEERPVEARASGGLAGYANKGKVVKEIATGKTPQAIEEILAQFRGPSEQTVSGAKRMAFPGIYKNPKEIAAEAAARVAPESPSLKRLFGVTREDLYQMGRGRKGNLPGALPGAAANPKGSAAAAGIMNPRNEQRLLDVMSEAEKHPELVRGMDPWYVMDPAYKRMEQMMGPERAAEEYRKLNTLMGMASPGSEVLVEIPRGTAANYLSKQGRFEDFMRYGGMRTPERPEDFASMPGHMYHKTSQAAPMQKYLESGQMEMSSPKVPMYIEASGVPETGFQTATPVGDAHWSRAVGLADTRGAKTIKGKEVVPGASVSNPEMTQLAPWWREKIAGELGIESVPAQARAWGAFAPQTGVESPIGAPKLELLATKIMETADRLGVSPETARDMVLRGENWAGKRRGGLVHG